MDAVQSKLKGILKWSLRQQQASSGSQPTQDSSIDDERMEWLKDAMNHFANQPSETQLMKSALAVLELQSRNELSSEGEKVVLESLELIEYFVEDLDNASDLVKFNGVEIISKYLSHNYDSDVIIGACSVITSSCQNHPPCQTAFGETVLSQLLALFQSDQTDSVHLKSLSAISSVIRGHPDGISRFFNENGCEMLLNCIKSNNVKLVIKSTFLLRALYFEHYAILEEMSQLITQYSMENLTKWKDKDAELLEQSQQLLYCILDKYPANISIIHQSALARDQLLQGVTDLVEDQETQLKLKKLLRNN